MENASTPTISSLCQQFHCLTFQILRCNFALQMLTSDSRHAILAFLVPVLLSFIAIKYQGKATSPFETHPVTTMASIFSLLFYGLTFASEQAFSKTRFAPIIRSFMALSSSLSLISLALILFPESMRFALYGSYLLLSMREAFSIFEKLRNLFRYYQPFRLRRRRTLLPRSSMDVHAPYLFHAYRGVIRTRLHSNLDADQNQLVVFVESVSAISTRVLRE